MGRSVLAMAGAVLLSGSAQAQCGVPISTFPYYEGFEAAPVWTTGGTNSDWAWGTPAHPFISSAGGGTKSWCVGGLTGSFYNYGELSYLESPCFDFTTLDHPWIQFKISWVLERQYDGMVLQYSLDGGTNYTNLGAFGDTDDCLNANWYNSNNIVNLTSASPRHGWSGGPAGSCTAGSSGGWITAKHCMTDLAHEPSVRFRFLFGAGTQCNNYDGAAIDDVLIQNAPPNVPAINYVCDGNTVEFINVASNCPTVFAWDFGDPPSGAANYASTEDATHTFSGPGQYSVTYTQSSACAAAGSVTLNLTLLDASLDAHNADCGPGTGSITAVVNGPVAATYLWSPGGQTTATITGLNGGDYSVTINAPGACPVTLNVTLQQNDNGLVVAGSSTDATCAGTSDGTAGVIVSGGTPGYTYDWAPTGGGGSSITDLAPGVYTCTITDATGCVTTHAETITAPTPVTLNVPVAVGTCAGTPVTLTAEAAGGTPDYTYAWSPEGPTVSPAANTTYTVISTDANGCASAPAQTEVQVGSVLTPTFTATPVEGCAPLCVAFAATDQLVDMIYTWDFGDGNTGEGWTAAHCYTEGGDNDVTLTVTDDTGCSGSSVQPDLVHVWPQPVSAFTASATTVTTEHATIQFTDQSTDATQWVWHFGDAVGSFSTEPSPAFTFTEVGCFTVSLVTASDQGCTAIDSTEICVEDPYAVYVPNAFTPNGDDINDVFGLVGSVRVPRDYELMVFDRWGRELWNSSVPYQTWDGAGTPQGVYIWKLRMRDTDGKAHEHIGHVALIR